MGLECTYQSVFWFIPYWFVLIYENQINKNTPLPVKMFHMVTNTKFHTTVHLVSLAGFLFGWKTLKTFLVFGYKIYITASLINYSMRHYNFIPMTPKICFKRISSQIVSIFYRIKINTKYITNRLDFYKVQRVFLQAIFISNIIRAW